MKFHTSKTKEYTMGRVLLRMAVNLLAFAVGYGVVVLLYSL